MNMIKMDNLDNTRMIIQPDDPRYNMRLDATRLLGMIASKINPHKENIVIFDLDGCIINNLPRQYEIVQQKLLYCNFPTIAESAKFEFQKYYNILNAINIDISQHEDAKKLFLSHFLQNDFLKYDIPIPGASNFVKKMMNLPINITYLTGRHHQDENDTMGPGTLNWLKKYEFLSVLDQNKTKLSLKPNKDISDLDWKRRYISELNEDDQTNIIAFVDNESSTLNSCQKLLPNTLFVKFNGAQTDSTFYQGFLLSSWEL
jgi:hypothetical protein